MSATLLEAPRRAAGSPPPPPQPPPDPGPSRARRRPGRNAFAIGIIVSVLVHILIFAIVRFRVVTTGPGVASAPRAINLPPSPAMRVLDVVGVEADVPTPQVSVLDPDEPVPAPTPEITAPPVTQGAPAAVPPAPMTGGRDPALTVTERITPRSGADPRLFERPSDPMRPELDLLNNVRARVYGSIQAYNDSVAAEAAAAARALDWTVRDKNGGRWGVSPTGIHLGTITLPLPALGTSADQRAAMREWSEIQQQAGRAEVNETFDERVRAIRARREAARDSARRGGGGN